jgi:hypothetical protein
MKHRVIKAARVRRGLKKCRVAEGPARSQSRLSSAEIGCPIPQRERQCEIETLLTLDVIPMTEVREIAVHQREKCTHGSRRPTRTGGNNES